MEIDTDLPRLMKPTWSKALIVAGVFLCSKCKCECDLKIEVQGQKLDQVLEKKEDKLMADSMKPHKDAYGPHNLKHKEKASSVFDRLGSDRPTGFDRRRLSPKREICKLPTKKWQPKTLHPKIKIDSDSLRVTIPEKKNMLTPYEEMRLAAIIEGR